MKSATRSPIRRGGRSGEATRAPVQRTRRPLAVPASEAAVRDLAPTRSRWCIFGAAPDTRNLGVTALGEAVQAGLRARLDRATVTVFDHGRGVGRANNRRGRVLRCGARHSKRLHQAETLWQVRVAARFGGLGNPAARLLLRSDAVLDLSGGDSFTDLYGRWRFRAITLPKLMALENRIPLVLLPQTYGPFRSTRAIRTARRIVRGARAAWARDERSYETLRELLGDDFDPARHRCGVDVAFSLPTREPSSTAEPARTWFDRAGTRVVGFNVSGLIHGNPDRAREDFGFVADYREIVTRTLETILAESEDRVLLVPHVLTPKGHYESDHEACERTVEALRDRGVSEATLRERVAVLPPRFDASETKWIIGRCDFFCGTRMHSTIAGLSSGVPTAAIAYSVKTKGVFETCGQGEHVADPREDGTDTVVEHLLDSWRRREAIRSSLQRHLPGVLDRAEEQLDAVVEACLVNRDA